jgi:hypothetical protein
LLRHLQRANDADTLLHVNADLLFGYPAVLVLEDFKRRLGIASQRRLMQHGAYLHLAVRAPLEFGHLGYGVELAELTVFSRQQARRQRKALAAQPFTRCPIDGFEPGLCGL